jgi:hypothetical protein
MKKISSANVCSALGKVKSSEINFTSKLPLLWESFSRADGEDEGEVPFGIKIIFSSAHEKLFLYQFIIFCFVCCCRDDFEIKKSSRGMFADDGRPSLFKEHFFHSKLSETMSNSRY